MDAQPSGGRLADRIIEGNMDGKIEGSVAGDRVGAETARLLAEDRERIGHDLQERVVRFLFEVSMKLHGALPLIEDGRAEQRVADALGDIDQIITNVRLAVFALLGEEPASPELGLRRRIVDVVDEVGQRIDQHPALALDGPIDTMADAGSADLLINALRELLLGLTRYAGVRSTRVGVAARGAPRPHLRVQLFGERPAGAAMTGVDTGAGTDTATGTDTDTDTAQDRAAEADLRVWLEEVREEIGAGENDLAAEVRRHAVMVSLTVPVG